jgi:tRNA-uridine 2-sulfurtransferase
MRIVVAMSGGVDSSVAAALLARQGHDVIGLSMQLYDMSAADAQSSRDAAGGGARFGTCCTIDDLHDARRVAARIGIPHYIVNFERKFQETVVSNFLQEYTAGRTPIPCVHCNGDLKFAMLVERAEGMDAAFVATGHYARVEHDETAGRYRLRRGVDPGKDQSYFLFTLTQAQLARAMFPLGDLEKPAVRELARELGLQVAGKPDSHEICFVPDGDYAAFVERHAAAPGAGAIRDQQGHVVGRHEGVHHFTVGQRKGLGLSTGIKLYVVRIDAADNGVTVGPRDALERHAFTASGVNWIAGAPPGGVVRVAAQVRHRHQAAAGTLEPIGADRARVVFDEPQAAIAPGQAAVFYEGDEVIGGGWIGASSG